MAVGLISCAPVSSSSSEPAPSSSDEPASSSEAPSSSSSSTYIGPDRELNIYGINDFHGRITPNPDEYETGIVRVGGFLKAKGKEPDTLIINSGDLWQGTLASNYNRGNLLTDVMNEVEFDSFTLGNHEFDWGPEYIRQNKARKDAETGYQTPFLAANIYNYDISSKTRLERATDLGQDYTITITENGLKVGIIGGIGSSQITDIIATYADAYDFARPPAIYKTLSDELRAQGCDVIIGSHHGGQGEVVMNGLTDISPVSGKRYFDAFLCAHTHSYQKTLENGVPFVQGSCNGHAYSEIHLTVAGDGSGEVTCDSYDYVYTSTIPESYDDEEIAALVETYAAESDPVGKEVLADITGTFGSSSDLPNLVCESMAKACEKQNIDIDIAICNQGRASLGGGEVTYSDLFSAVPFDNQVYILEVPGKELVSRADRNFMYRVNPNAFSDTETYTAAVIDYVATHRSTNREYDYFLTANWDTAYIFKEGDEIPNYRDITADNLRELKTLNTDDYDSSLVRYNAGYLNQNVTF